MEQPFRSGLTRAAIGKGGATRRSVTSAAFALAAGLSVAGASASGRADPFIPTLPVSFSGPTTVLEGAKDVLYPFTVTNNTGHDLSIDFALATIQYVSGDATDFIQFSTSGFIGLISHDNFIPAGQVGHYIYSIDAPGTPDGTSDFGIYSFNFFIELSDISRDLVPEDVGRAQANLLLHTDGGNLDPVALQSLGDCLQFPSRCGGPEGFLYPPSQNPGFAIFGGAATIAATITDVPEPSSLGLISGLVLALIGFRWRNRRPASRKL